MKNRRSLLMLCAAVFAAALVALPGVAHADDITLTQKDFLDREGVYTKKILASGNTYTLAENVTGYIEVSFGSNYTEPAYLNLNGNTLTCPSGDNDSVNLITTTSSGKLVVSNGNLVQPKSGQSVVRADGGTVTLDLGNENKATSASFMCIDAERGTVNIQSGRYVNSNSSEGNEELLRAGDKGSIVVTGGVFERNGNSPIAKTQGSSNSSIVLSGGSYNAYPEGITALGTGKSLHWRNKYYVDDTAIVKRAYNYYVETGSTIFGDVCFEKLEDAKKFAKERSLDESSVHGLTYTVTFNSNGGNPSTIDDKSVHYGYTVTEPTVTKEGYKLLGWTYDTTGGYFDFDGIVTGDLELTAQWLDVVAKVGDVEYDSLQKAIDAANDGDTITLCKSVEESVTFGTASANKKLTLDLGSNTLTGTATNGAITVNTKCELTIKNGTVIAPKDDCLLLTKMSSNGSVVNLEEGLSLSCTATGSNENAVCVKGAATVNFNGGSFAAADRWAVNVQNAKGVLNFKGGSFTSSKESSTGTGNASVYMSAGSIDVSGGEFSGHIDNPNKCSLAITGGTFGDNVNKDDIDADEYHMLQNSDGKYVVSKHVKEWVIDKKPTATEAGKKHQKCTVDVCSWESEYEEIPAGSDVDAPEITGLADGASYDCGKNFTVTDASDFTVTVNGEKVEKNADGTFTLPVGEGQVLSVVATDKWGNASKAVTVYNYKDHDWQNPQPSSDGNSHYYTCTHTGCEVKTKTEDHKGGTATCKTKAVCEVCGESYGELDPNNHEGGASSSYNKYDGANHWKTYTCCDAVFPDSAHPHTLTTVVDVKPTETTKGSEHDECSTCGYKSDKRDIPATGGPVIDGLVNGGSYDIEDDKPTFTVTSASGVKSVTVNGETVTPSEGNYTLDVTGDEVTIVATAVNGTSTTIVVSCSDTHDWGAWESNNNGSHFRNCKHTGCSGHQDRNCNDGKDGATATCVSQAVCVDCHASYGTVNPNNHVGNSTWHCEDNEHWKTCDSCGKEISDTRAEHNPVWKSDSTQHWQECKDCGYKTAAEQHDLVWKSDGTQHWQECKDCGYATDKAGHTYGDWKATEDGSKHEHTCTACGATDAAEHDYVWVTDKEATATEEGSAHEECKDCGHKSGQTKVLPKTGGDDSGDKGDKSDDKGGKKDDSGKGNKGSKKDDSKQIPATGDPAAIVSGIAATGAALAAAGAIRRRK